MLTPQRQAKLNKIVKARQEGVIILEDIYDPHNAQAVFRTCEVFGFQKIALIFDRQKAFKPKRIGKLSSSSANKWLDFLIYDKAVMDAALKPTQVCFEQLKAEGYEIWATVASPAIAEFVEGAGIVTDLGSEVQDIYAADFSKRRIAIAFGNEQTGLSDEARKHADRLITIPQAGWVESFNLSVAAAIFIYEITRQRQAIGMEQYLLEETEQSQLATDFERR